MTELTVRFGRLEHRGVLLGLDATQVGVVSAALVVAVIGEYSMGAFGLLLTLPVWLSCLACALVPVRGRPALSWFPLITDWGSRRLRGGTSFRFQLRGSERQSLTLPGIRGELAIYTGPRTGAALVHDRRTGTVTGALRLVGAGFVLNGEAGQHGQVAGWSRLLAGVCQQPSVVRMQVLHRTTAGFVTLAQRWWARQASQGRSWASQVLAEVVAEAQQSCSRQETLLAAAIRVPRTGRRRLSAASLALAERHLEAIADSARAAELHVLGWMDPSELASALRISVDPTTWTAPLAGPAVGPMAVEERWDGVQTDRGHHAVYWVREWPRSPVHPGFLQPLLLAPNDNRSFALFAEPLTTAKALKDIRRAKVEHVADAAQRVRMGQLEDEAIRAEADDIARREQELVAGHGELRFIGLVVVTAASEEELAEACAATETAAAQAMCELRLLVGQQAAAFAAAAYPLARAVS